MSAAPRTAAGCARELAAAIAEQTRVCRVLADLSARQDAAIDDGDADALLRLLADKQRLIAEREGLDRAAAPLRSAWETLRDAASADVRAPVEGAWGELVEVMGELVRREEGARSKLEQRQSETGIRANRVQTGKAMLRAYGAALKHPDPSPRYQDRQS